MKSTLEQLYKKEPNWILALFGIAEDLNVKFDIDNNQTSNMVVIFNYQNEKYSTKWNSIIFFKLKGDENVYNICEEIEMFFDNYKNVEKFWLNDLMNFYDIENGKIEDLFNVTVKHMYGPEYEILDNYNPERVQLEPFITLNKDFKLKKGKEIEYIYKKFYHYTKDCLYTYIKLKEIGVKLTGLKVENLSIIIKFKDEDCVDFEYQRFNFSEHLTSGTQVFFKIQGDKNEYNIKKYYKLFYENYENIIWVKETQDGYAFIKHLEDNIYIPHNISGLAYADEDGSDSGYYIDGIKYTPLDFTIAQREWKYKRLT